MRVFQEQIREQLSLTWGEGNDPDCRGLSVGEFARVDLDKIDLSAAIDTPPEIPEAEVKKRVEGFLETIDSKMDALKKSEEWKQAYFLTESDGTRLIVTTLSRQLTSFFIGYHYAPLTIYSAQSNARNTPLSPTAAIALVSGESIFTASACLKTHNFSFGSSYDI